MFSRRVVVFAVCIVCVAVVGGLVFYSWYSEQVQENLRGFSARLEDDGFVVEPKVLGEFFAETPREWQFFSDFSSYAKQSGVSFVYYDQEIQGLFFAVPSSSAGGGAEVNVFYYNKVF